MFYLKRPYLFIKRYGRFWCTLPMPMDRGLRESVKVMLYFSGKIEFFIKLKTIKTKKSEPKTLILYFVKSFRLPAY